MIRKKAYIEIKGNSISHWHIPYTDLLNTIEWYERKERVMKRDSKVCQACHKKADEKMHPDDKYYYRQPTEQELKKPQEPVIIKDDGQDDFILKQAIPIGIRIDNPTILHVHHTVYYWDCLPWEYNDNELVSLCADCHDKTHRKEVIPVYENRLEKTEKVLTPCYRCNGIGYLHQYDYYYEGVCFKCKGLRFEELLYR